MYPEIEPHFTDMLAVTPQHSIYVERSGNKGGYPVFFLHGGPGSHSRSDHRRYFDPECFDIVLFDQRGCGKSLPAGETAGNSTWELVEDINAIKGALDVEKKISLFGGSWGSTLALAYALKYPSLVEELILRGIFLGSNDEVRWYTKGLSRFAPEAWEDFSCPEEEDLVDYYYQQIHGEDESSAIQAACRWYEYEARIMNVGSEAHTTADVTSFPPKEEMLARVRIQLHFLKHQCFLDDGYLLESVKDLELPVTLVQGALDLVCPPITAHRLQRALPQSTLRLLNDAGHGAQSGILAEALCEEADKLRDRLRNRDGLTIQD